MSSSTDRGGGGGAARRDGGGRGSFEDGTNGSFEDGTNGLSSAVRSAVAALDLVARRAEASPELRRTDDLDTALLVLRDRFVRAVRAVRALPTPAGAPCVICGVRVAPASASEHFARCASAMTPAPPAPTARADGARELSRIVAASPLAAAGAAEVLHVIHPRLLLVGLLSPRCLARAACLSRAWARVVASPAVGARARERANELVARTCRLRPAFVARCGCLFRKSNAGTPELAQARDLERRVRVAAARGALGAPAQRPRVVIKVRTLSGDGEKICVFYKKDDGSTNAAPPLARLTAGHIKVALMFTEGCPVEQTELVYQGAHRTLRLAHDDVPLLAYLAHELPVALHRHEVDLTLDMMLASNGSAACCPAMRLRALPDDAGYAVTDVRADDPLRAAGPNAQVSVTPPLELVWGGALFEQEAHHFEHGPAPGRTRILYRGIPHSEARRLDLDQFPGGVPHFELCY